MNSITLLFTAFGFASIGASAQSGVYKTPGDFESRQLAYVQHADEKHLIRTDIPFNQSSVKVIQGDESIYLKKADIYGYRDGKNQDFRFYDNNAYRIIDASGFLLYSREENVVNGKAKTRETKYYFSVDPQSPIRQLGAHNLKLAFPANRKFHDLLDLHFSNDKKLMQYDRLYKEYKVKSIFASSLQ